MTLTTGTKYNGLPGLDTFTESWELLLPLSTNKCVYIYADQSTSYPTARVMSISGTSISSVGSAATLDSTGINSNTMRAVALSSSTFILLWSRTSDNTQRVAVVGSVSGTTITPGSVQVITDLSGSGYTADVGKVTSTKGIACYRDIDDGGKGKAVAFTISGTTIGSPGSAATFESGSVATNFGVEELNQSDKVICTYRISGGTPCKAVCMSISGTTITPGTTISLEGTETTLKPRTLRMSDTKAFAFYEQTSGINDTVHVHEIENTTGTTIVSNGSTGFGDLTTGDVTYGYARLTSTVAVVIYLSSGDEKAVEITLTGSNPTAGTPLVLEASVASVDNMGIAPVASDTDKAAIIYSLIDGNVLTSSVAAGTLKSHLWKSTDGAASFTNIGDISWGSNIVTAMVAKPNDSYQTIWVSLSDGDIYKTTDGGTTWASLATLGYSASELFLLDGDTLLASNRATGGNRVSTITSGGSVSHLNTSHSTTGEGSSVQGIA